MALKTGINPLKKDWHSTEKDERTVTATIQCWKGHEFPVHFHFHFHFYSDSPGAISAINSKLSITKIYAELTATFFPNLQDDRKSQQWLIKWQPTLAPFEGGAGGGLGGHALDELVP